MNNPDTQPATPPVNRRRFLSVTGVALAAGAALLAGCKKDDDEEPAPTASSDNDPALPELVLANSQTGYLNYLYLVEQLHAGFLEQVSAAFAAGFSAQEQELFREMRDQQQAHRQLLRAKLGSDALTDATLNFSAINLTERTAVLNQARIFADLAETTYAGVAEKITEPEILLLTLKIGSVESRQAAYVRNLVQSGSFAATDAVTANGLIRMRKPAVVLSQIDPFIRNRTSSSLA